MHLRRMTPLVAIAALLVIVADVSTVLARHHWIGMLIGQAVGNGDANTKAITSVTDGIKKIQGELQGFALIAAPVPLVAAGLAWASGHRRGLGMAGAALGGLSLALLAGPIAK